MFSTGENNNSEMLPIVATINIDAYYPYEQKKAPQVAVAASATRPRPARVCQDDTSLKAVRSKFIRLWAAIQQQGLEKAARQSFQSGNSAAQSLAWFLAGQLTAWTDESLTELNVREAWRVARVLYTDMLQHPPSGNIA